MAKFLFSENFLASSILFSLPIIFAAFAALISSKAGMLNINIEGSMSVAALAGALISHYTGSWVMGMLCAILTGIIMSLLLVAASIRLRTNSVLVGIALNTLATGISVYALYAILNVKGDSSIAPSAMIPNLHIPLLSDIPVIGRILFSQNVLFYVAIAAVLFLKWMLDRTRIGLRIKAVGFSETTARSVGIPINSTKATALIFCGALTGLGGAYLSMAYMSYFSVGMVGGRGFIGLAAEAMGGGMPGMTLLFAFLFGMVDYFAVGAQAVLGIPYELLNTLPYLITIIALALYALIVRRRAAR